MIRVPRPWLFGSQEAGGIDFCCGLGRRKFICFIAFLMSGLPLPMRRKHYLFTFKWFTIL